MKKIIFLGLICGGINLWADNFTNTCENLQITKATISAECKASNGGTYKTALRLRGVSNRNGVLTVESNLKLFSKFHKTCKDCAVDANGVLGGRCKNDRGAYVWTQLDLKPLLFNYNGTLVYPLEDKR